MFGMGAFGSAAFGDLPDFPPFHVGLLERSKELIEKAERGLGIVMAQTACEVLTEQALTSAFAKKGVPFLVEPMEDFCLSYSLGNEKLRKLYTALTEDEIQKCGFWHNYKVLTTLRNGVVHRGETISPQQAQDSWQAASDFVQHVDAVMKNL